MSRALSIMAWLPGGGRCLKPPLISSMALPTCPWHTFEHAPAQFCEASLCAWVRQPGNTVSNLGFVLAAFLIFQHTRRHDAGHLRPLAYISLATGLVSAFFHASKTWIGGILDFGFG